MSAMHMTSSLYEKQMIEKLINDYCLKEEQCNAKDLYESFMKSDEAKLYFDFGDDNSINLEAIESALKEYSEDIVLFHMTEEQRKEHYEHVVTITSYDEKSKSFKIIDQENLESVSFTYKTVDIDSLKKAAYN